MSVDIPKTNSRLDTELCAKLLQDPHEWRVDTREPFRRVMNLTLDSCGNAVPASVIATTAGWTRYPATSETRISVI